MFSVLQVQLACDQCEEAGKAGDCIHKLHLIQRWQVERHTLYFGKSIKKNPGTRKTDPPSQADDAGNSLIFALWQSPPRC